MIAENDAKSELQAWAREQLQVPRDAPRQAVKKAFLRRLQADRFCPRPSVRHAYELLRGDNAHDVANPSPGNEAWLEVQQQVREKVEQFAAEFFQLPPGMRQARWEKLAPQVAPFPRIGARLRNFQLRLTMEVKQRGDDAPLVDRLARACCELFVLRPLEQAVLRQSMQEEFAVEPSKWALTAKILRTQSPEIAALAPDLVQWLTSYEQRATQTARAQVQASSVITTNAAPPLTRISQPPSDYSGIWGVALGMTLLGISGLLYFGSSMMSPDFNGKSSTLQTRPLPFSERLIIEDEYEAKLNAQADKNRAKLRDRAIQRDLARLRDLRKLNEDPATERYDVDPMTGLLRKRQQPPIPNQDAAANNPNPSEKQP